MTILMATDFSKPAFTAYRYAAALALRLKAQLVILNVLPTGMTLDPEYPVNALYLKQLHEEWKAEMEQLTRRARQDRVVFECGSDGRIYPWGNQMAGLSRANYGRTGLSGPVRDRPERLLLYPPIVSVDKYENAVSPYGLFNMAGNVAEWVADWYDSTYYTKGPDRNPKGPDHGTSKAFRGGAW